MQAFGYVRSNLPGQKGPDAPEQKAEIEAYCKEHGLDLFSIVEDSGDDVDVPLTHRLKGCLLQVIPENSHVIFPTYSVMCRNHADWQRLMDSLLAHKHVVHILEWGVSTDAPAWPAVQNIVQTLWDKRWEDNKSRLDQARATSARTLQKLGVKAYWPRNRKPPGGFKIRTSTRRDSRGRRYFLLMPDLAQREQMAKIHEMIERGMHADEIVLVLNRANILNVRTGKTWYSKSVWAFYRDFKGLEKRDKELARYMRQD